MTEQLVDEIRRITNGNKEFAALFQNGETPQVKRYDMESENNAIDYI